jgi:hypothetical protein
LISRNFLFAIVIVIIAFLFLVALVDIVRTPKVPESTNVVCVTEAIYGHDVYSISNETTTTITTVNAYPVDTVTSSYITNVSISATPGYSTSITGLGVCTFTGIATNST